MENAPPADPAPAAEPAPKAEAAAAPPAKKNETKELAIFLVKLVVVVLVLRSFLFSPFSIPSESMLPRLLIGDYLFITKFNYGYSRHSLPFSVPLLPNMHWADPARGDVVVFKSPTDEQDWIKRVIGLPGDTIQMRNGQLILNGKPVPKERVADFTIPLTPNYPAKPLGSDENGCPSGYQDRAPDGTAICRYQRFRETLPGGKSYEVLDKDPAGPLDTTGVYTVPKGHVFLMGDNRDNSQDSRVTTGISYVSMDRIQGKAVVSFWSTDGSASWLLPWTWFTAARWGRIGEGF